MSTQTWKDVWAARRLDPSRTSVLSRLLAADGMDTGFGSVEEVAWQRYVRESAEFAGITPLSSVFELGCGAGAWLYELSRKGCAVGGLDASPALIGYAREHLPDGRWEVGDAAALELLPQYDFVAASGVFLYFPSYAYAANVLESMIRKAKRGVLVLDVPDLATRDAALDERRKMAGEELYAQRYAGLDHLYFDRDWFSGKLESLGAVRTIVSNQRIDGYANARYRFNVFAWLG